MSELRNLNEEQNHFERNLIPDTDSQRPQMDLDPAPSDSKVSLTDAVEVSVANYFTAMGNQEITELYDLLLQEVEAPLLAVVMRETSYNQSRAAKMLGLNRGTLRKKLKRYDLL